MENLTPAELSLLRELWKRESASIRDLSEAIYASSTDSKTAAVSKLLQRMTAKGFVVCRRDDRPHLYVAAMSEQEYVQRQLQGLADQHCDGKLAPLATTLVQTKGFNQRQRRQLRDLIHRLWPDEADEGKGGDNDD
ncbi:Penicillinase repressor [Rubripirellula tenax]|uniref:Penicillinase repressor n=1 Tax=Rubripirellula tenax TaxID=2528015 RepID=A0A5C6EME8_9BACT|nr:BlaI/MecI/CopY family transcriptional regulator [Rubripirellula tenax]TWU48811.1 Penicillinase repressor [Rubripirellula tenax]